MKQSIYIKTIFEGFHSWPFAPKEVEFLKNKHRHLFNVYVEVGVNHNDRDVEFFMFKREVDKFINEKFDKQDLGSCEMMCERIYQGFKEKYSILEIRVNEDDENGAILKITE